MGRFTLIRISQNQWEHAIPKQSAERPRLSVTFSKFDRESVISGQNVPPIRRPRTQPPILDPEAPNPTQTQPAKRVLLLTDSIHRSFRVAIFPASAKVDCIKRVNFELQTIDKHEHLFGDCDSVFISCGINDLSAGTLTSLMREI